MIFNLRRPFLIAAISLVFLTFGLQTLAQNISSDDPRVGYLERKLTFNYYNADQGMWWINTFTYQEESGTFRFKSVSAKNPAKLMGKKYTERIFSLSDLNPYLIRVTPIEENHGYLVKGDLLRIEAVKHQDLIKKSINMVPATAQSYIHFVLPDYLNDSTISLSDSLRTTFESLIVEATTIYRQEEPLENKALIFKTLIGEFEVGNVKRFAEKHSDYVISFEEYQDRSRVKAGFFGYDMEKDIFYELDVYEKGQLMESHFKVDPDREILTLVGISHPERRIVFENKSKVVYYFGEQLMAYRPSRSY